MSEERESYTTTATWAALAEPFPAEAHDVLEKKNNKTGRVAKVTYVAWHHYVARLNEVAPDWSMGSPIMQVIGGKLVMGLPLTICGVTRINFGDESEDKDSYGTAGTNAFAQAFKRTAALFGLGLYLYDGGGTPPPRARPQRQQPQEQPPDNGNDQPSDARLVEVFFGKHKGKTLGEVAEKDDDYVEWLASTRYEPQTPKAELVQRAARAMIARKVGAA